MALIPQSRLIAQDKDTGAVLPFAYAKFTLTGTDTPVAIWQDAGFTTPHTNPVQANSGGVFPAIYSNPDDGLVRVRVIAETGDFADPQYDTDPVDNGATGIPNSGLADMPAGTLKGNLTGATAKPDDYTTDEVTDALRFASETEQGVVTFATVAEASTGTVTDKAVTPAGLLQFFNDNFGNTQNLANPGHIVIGPALICFGSVGPINIDSYIDVVFDTPFSGSPLAVLHTPSIASGYDLRHDSWSLAQRSNISDTGFRVYCASSANAAAIYVDYLAVGIAP
jgi:hypothetical protein